MSRFNYSGLLLAGLMMTNGAMAKTACKKTS